MVLSGKYLTSSHYLPAIFDLPRPRPCSSQPARSNDTVGDFGSFALTNLCKAPNHPSETWRSSPRWLRSTPKATPISRFCRLMTSWRHRANPPPSLMVLLRSLGCLIDPEPEGTPQSMRLTRPIRAGSHTLRLAIFGLFSSLGMVPRSKQHRLPRLTAYAGRFWLCV